MTRPLTKDERNHARHLLQELSEHAKSVRNAIEPETGVMMVTDMQWKEQWESLTAALDLFTKDVMPKGGIGTVNTIHCNGTAGGSGSAGGGAGGDITVYTSGGRMIARARGGPGSAEPPAVGGPGPGGIGSGGVGGPR